MRKPTSTHKLDALAKTYIQARRDYFQAKAALLDHILKTRHRRRNRQAPPIQLPGLDRAGRDK